MCDTMSSNGKRYTEEFKIQIIERNLDGNSVSSLAKEYGLAEQTIYRWKKLYAPDSKLEEEGAILLKENEELLKKFRQLELENEILNKARVCIQEFSLEEIASFIYENKDIYPIKLMCKLLEMNRSTYYKIQNQESFKKNLKD